MRSCVTGGHGYKVTSARTQVTSLTEVKENSQKRTQVADDMTLVIGAQVT